MDNLENKKATKPLGQKAYGSIPHLPGSRLGPGDHKCSDGQARIACEKPRDKHDRIIVQEKLDGSNVAVAKVEGQILALTRAGYLASTSPYRQHHFFAMWVEQNKARFNALLQDKERVSGEWLAMAHGTRYQLPHEPFVPFDILTGTERLVYDQFADRMWQHEFTVPFVLHMGGSFSIEQMIAAIQKSGHGALDEVEGAVWRVERKGRVDFLCKYVHHHKQDGKYFEENNNGNEIWNIDIEAFLAARP